MNSPYEDYYLEIVPYYNEDGMTPFSYIIPKSLEYFTATDGENDNNKSNNYAIAISDESSQSFKSDYKFLQDSSSLKVFIDEVTSTDQFKRAYNNLIDSTPFKEYLEAFIQNYPKGVCFNNINNYFWIYFDNVLTEQSMNIFVNWANNNASDIRDILSYKFANEIIQYFYSVLNDRNKDKIREYLACYINNYIANNTCTYTSEGILEYVKKFVYSLNYDSNGLKELTCDCDIHDDMFEIISGIVVKNNEEHVEEPNVETPEEPENNEEHVETPEEHPQENNPSATTTPPAEKTQPKKKDAEESSSSTIWIIIVIIVVIIIIVVVVVIFMKKSKSKAASALAEVGGAVFDAPPDLTRVV